MPNSVKKRPVGRPKKVLPKEAIAKIDAPAPTSDIRGRKKDTMLIQAQVPARLLLAVRKVMRANDIGVRQIVTWALTEYLRSADPKKLRGVFGKGAA